MNWVQRINPAWFLAGAAFFLPIKPAPVNLFLALTTLFALLNSKCRRNIGHLFARAELTPLWLLLGFLAVTYFYSSNSESSYLEFVSKYGRLALIPVLASVLLSQENRHIVGKGFLSGMTLVLALSYAIWLGVDPSLFGAKATDMYAIPSNPTVFKSHITHNFFLVVAIYLWLLCFFRTEKLALKGVYAALTLLGLVNLFGMIDGRTGWLVFMVIPLYFGYQKLGFKGFLLAGFVFAAMLVAAYFLVDNIHDRFSTTWLEIQQVLRDKPQQGTSIGERVIYLTSSWSAFLQAPFFGYGLGGVQGAVQVLAHLLDMGFAPACELYADGVNASYFDTREVTGGFTEIHGDPPHILGIFAEWRRAHEIMKPGDPLIWRRKEGRRSTDK